MRFRQRNNQYPVSETIEALLYPLILGLGRVESTEPLRRNGVFQYLAGLPGFPATTTLRRFLQRVATLGRDKFVSLHDCWRREMLDRPKPLRKAILDLDTTVLTVYGRQKGSAVGFNPKKRGRPSYMSLLCFEGQLEDVLCGSYHAGDTHASSVVRPILVDTFRKLPDSVKQVRIRADGAFFDHKFVESIEGRMAYYVIVARLTCPLQEKLGGVLY
ncbi:MAG: transposase [Planctomycetes bacterium]|nr:transposase [Planctomycetota bacterium]